MTSPQGATGSSSPGTGPLDSGGDATSEHEPIVDVRRWGAALVSVPLDTEGDRSLLQRRLSTFGGAAAALSLGFFVLVNLLVQVTAPGDWSHWWRSPVNHWHLLTSAVLAGLWLSCRRAERSRDFLRAVDATATVGVGLGFGQMGASAYWGGDPTLPMVLAITHALGFRAVWVPSTARRTAGVHALALAPIVLSAWKIHLARNPGEWVEAAYDSAYTALWCLLCLIVSSLTSRVIYGLTEHVRETRRLGQYTLVEKIGEGGMGTVYRARHAMLRRPTAIKLLRAENADERALLRFEREVQLTSELTHPNTVAIYDYGRTQDGTFYYAMEYLAGMNLQTLVDRHGPQPAARVIHLLRQVASALSEAHGVGLIHRDVKPANVIVCQRGGLLDVAKVVDFGLAKPIEPAANTGLTGTNVLVGTPLYMAPEAVQTPDLVDGRSDLYALGAVGFLLLTGRSVFVADNLVEVLAAHLHTAPVAPSTLVAGVPAELEAALLRCLAKDPAERYARAEDLEADLARCSHACSWSQREARAWWDAHRTPPLAVIRPPGSDAASALNLTVDVRAPRQNTGRATRP